MRLLPYQSVLNLIEDAGFGTFKLFQLPDGFLVGGSHLSEDSKDSKLTAQDLIASLERKLDALGAGNYMIKLKKTLQSQAGTEVTYRFTYGGESVAAVQTQSDFHGLGSPDKLEDLIQRRVTEALKVEKEKNEIKDQMKELMFKLKELETAKRRRPAAKKDNFLNGLMDLAKLAGVTLIAERYPKSVPLVEKTLATMASSVEEEEEEDEEETGFKAPEE